jgi:hypothetical protein
MAITVPVTEMSYRYLETPIRKNGVRKTLGSLRKDTGTMVAAGSVALLVVLASFSLLSADPHCVGEVNCSLEAAAQGPDDTLPTETTATVPVTAAPGSTVATTTTVPKAPAPYVAIGESVMVGAEPLLQSSGVLVQAKEGRWPEGVKNAVILLRESGDIGAGTTIVIQVGTNAPLTQGELDAIMTEVPIDAGTVAFMTLHADISYIPANNDLIRGMSTLYPDVRIIDWDARASEVELCPDGIHISCNGSAPAKFYSNLILEAFGLPAIT